MGKLVFYIFLTFFVICFVRPKQIADFINQTNHTTVAEAKDVAKALTGVYPSAMPVIVVGSSRDQDTCQLEGELQQRGVAFTVADVLLNPQVRPVMNKLGKQSIPTTIVGTYLISGNDADGVQKAIDLEQKSGQWPAQVIFSHASISAGAVHNRRSAKHGQGHSHGLHNK